MTGLRLLLLILAIVTFIILAVLGLLLTTAAVTFGQFFGIVGIGLALFAASFLPIP